MLECYDEQKNKHLFLNKKDVDDLLNQRIGEVSLPIYERHDIGDYKDYIIRYFNFHIDEEVIINIDSHYAIYSPLNDEWQIATNTTLQETKEIVATKLTLNKISRSDISIVPSIEQLPEPNEELHFRIIDISICKNTKSNFIGKPSHYFLVKLEK